MPIDWAKEDVTHYDDDDDDDDDVSIHSDGFDFGYARYMNYVTVYICIFIRA